MTEETPTTRWLLLRLIQLAKGMLSALEKYIAHKYSA